MEAIIRLRAWQKIGVLPPFPIVAATAADDPASKEQCIEAGMDGYLAKPLHMDQLADELHRVLPTGPLSKDAEP